ncbi:MAG: SIMPL domain-containing protein [Ignavibacteriae bacterium]|nr:SIMPL domain-containing protein [Ignavibacteriota bacterium]
MIVTNIFVFTDNVYCQEQRRTISVTGVGIVSILPNRVEIGMVISSRDDEATPALEKNNKLLQKVINAIREEGIADSNIITSNFEIQPQSEYVDRDEPPKEYFLASSTLRIFSNNISLAGLLIDKMVKNGARSIGTPIFSYIPLDSIRNQAYLLAVVDAKSKAQQLAESFGVIVGEPVQITVDMGDIEPKKYYYRLREQQVMALQAGVVKTIIMPNYVTKQVTVNATFELIVRPNQK